MLATLGRKPIATEQKKLKTFQRRKKYSKILPVSHFLHFYIFNFKLL
jgi:hypothetical protein